jgi:hypothetical protein
MFAIAQDYRHVLSAREDSWMHTTKLLNSIYNHLYHHQLCLLEHSPLFQHGCQILGESARVLVARSEDITTKSDYYSKKAPSFVLTSHVERRVQR